MFPVTPLPAGATPKGSELAGWSGQIDSLTKPGWTSYTPVWTCAGSAPSLGNGTLVGRYRRSADSDLMIVEVMLTAGSTTTYGTGFFIFSVPTNASASSTTFTVGSSFIDDVSTQGRPGVAKFNASSQLIVYNSAGVVTGASPMTWANGDTLRINIQYEPA